MGRRDDDFDFDDDLFGDEDDLFSDDDFGDLPEDDLRGGFSDDDELGFDDEPGDSFDFGDDEFGLPDDADFDSDYLDTGVEDDFDLEGDEEPVTERQGPSRTFIIIAGVMILFFAAGLILLISIITGPQQPTERQLTATSIVETNVAIEITLTQGAEFFATESAGATLTAEAATDTPTPTETPEPAQVISSANVLTGPDAGVFEVIDSVEPGDEIIVVGVTEDGDWFNIDFPGGNGWVEAASLSVPDTTVPVLQGPPTPMPSPTEVTGVGVPTITPTPTPTFTLAPEDPTPTQETGVPIDSNAVGMTATALAELFLTPVDLTPGAVTPAVGGAATPAVDRDVLPDTGLFDDLGPGGLLAFLLMGTGLTGLIVLSRQLRAANRRNS